MNASHLKRFIIAIVFAQFLIFTVLFVNSHTGRQSQVANSRAACERGKLDRQSIVVIASSVYNGFRGTDSKVNGELTPQRRHVEADLNKSIKSLSSRIGAKLDCAKAFPNAGWFPWNDNKADVFKRPTIPPHVPLLAPAIKEGK